MDFIKNALREFRHVVWPTREETKKYFVVVLAVLVAFGTYLFVVGNIFSEILFGLKNLVNPASTSSADIQLPEGLEGLNIQTGVVETTEAETVVPEVENPEAIVEEVPAPDETIVEDVVVEEQAPIDATVEEVAEVQ